MSTAIKAAKSILNIAYGVLKLFPCNPNKVLFLSRQSDTLSLDFAMLRDKLLEKNPKLKIKSICKRVDDSKQGMFGFAMDILRSMYHLSTSSVCVLDAYWPAVSILNHKKSLTVIQMWHAVGKIKQSGYQTLDKPGGRSSETAEQLCMHKNYDIIIAGGKAWNPYYCASFNTTEDKLLNIGLPRLDHLLATEQANREKVLAAYPQFAKKQTILYAPTFRRGMELNWQELLEHIDFSKYDLIIKGHPNQQIDCDREGVYLCPEFKAIDLLAVCDHLITDYSAIAVEAAVLNKKTYYYLFDYEAYNEQNGLNVSPFDSMPTCSFHSAKDLVLTLMNMEYDQPALDRYREKYLPDCVGSCTDRLAETVISNLK